MTLEAAYRSAGYDPKTSHSAQVIAARLLKQPHMAAAFEAAKAEKARIKAEATKVAIEYSGITQARVATELGRIGFANMADYMRTGNDGMATADFTNLTREQSAAISEFWVDGQDRLRFRLADKRAALMDIAKLFGWIVEKRENKIVDEFDSMTTEQIEAWLDERAEQRVKIRQRESADGRRRSGVGTLRPTTAQGKTH